MPFKCATSLPTDLRSTFRLGYLTTIRQCIKLDSLRGEIRSSSNHSRLEPKGSSCVFVWYVVYSSMRRCLNKSSKISSVPRSIKIACTIIYYNVHVLTINMSDVFQVCEFSPYKSKNILKLGYLTRFYHCLRIAFTEKRRSKIILRPRL